MKSVNQHKTNTLPAITSPCIGNCCLNFDDVCVGCYRHIDEITGWSQADDQQRRHILTQCQIRQQKHRK